MPVPSIPTIPTLGRRGGGVTVADAAVVAPPTVYNDVIDVDSPAAHYKCADASGAVLTARVGPNAAIASTVTYAVTGLVANNGDDPAISLLRPSGTNGGCAQVAQSPAQAALDGGSGLTYELWLSPLSDTPRSSGQNLIDRTLYGLTLTADNKPSIFYGASGASSSTATDALLAGHTYHLVYTFDGTTHKVYVDAVSVISVVGTLTAGGALGIGCYPGGSDSVHATIDEVTLYKTALSGARIAAHHTAGVSFLAFAIGRHISNWR